MSFSHPLGLSKIEWGVLQGARRLQTRFGINDYMPSAGKPTQNAIRRLVERGFLTLLANDHPQPWPVVTLTPENIEAYNKALAALPKETT